MDGRACPGRARSVALGAGLLVRLDPHDALAHLDLIADTRLKVAHDARIGGDERVLHLHRFDHGEALASFDPVAVLDRDLDQAPVHRRADRGIALPRSGLGLRERINELDERLPPAGKGVNAPIRLVQRDLPAALSLRDRTHIGAFDEMHPHGDAVDSDVDANAARTDEFEGIGDTPRVTRVETPRAAFVAPLEQKPRGPHGRHVCPADAAGPRAGRDWRR